MKKIPLRLFLKNKREELNLSQQDVADYVGISKSAVSRLESGDIKNMGVDKLKKLSSILKIDPLKIINYEDEDDEIETESIFIPKDYFTNATEAMNFLLNQTVVMGFNGFDIRSLPEEEQINYANEVLDMMKLVSLKYKDRL